MPLSSGGKATVPDRTRGGYYYQPTSYVQWTAEDEKRLRELRRIPANQRTASEEKEKQQLEEARRRVNQRHDKVRNY